MGRYVRLNDQFTVFQCSDDHLHFTRSLPNILGEVFIILGCLYFARYQTARQALTVCDRSDQKHDIIFLWAECG